MNLLLLARDPPFGYIEGAIVDSNAWCIVIRVAVRNSMKAVTPASGVVVRVLESTGESSRIQPCKRCCTNPKLIALICQTETVGC